MTKGGGVSVAAGQHGHHRGVDHAEAAEAVEAEFLIDHDAIGARATAVVIRIALIRNE